MKQYYVYIMTNKPRGTLYTGSTSNIMKRIWLHENKLVEGFPSKYGLDRLVFYEVHGTYGEAARREKRIKKWRREWKLNLIRSMNPTWRDLYEDMCE